MTTKIKFYTGLFVLLVVTFTPSGQAASQFTAGFTFSDDTNSALSVITSNRLRLLIESATIRPAMFSDQTNQAAALSTNDTVLIWSAANSNLYEVTVDWLLLTNQVGAGLTGGSRAPLALRLDTNVFMFGTSNALTLNTNISVTNTLYGEGTLFLGWNTNAANWVRINLNNLSNAIVPADSITTNKLAPPLRTNLISGWAVYEAVGNAIVNQNGLFSGVTSNATGVLTFTFATARDSTNYLVTGAASAQDWQGDVEGLTFAVRSNTTSYVTVSTTPSADGSTDHPARLYLQIIGN